MSLTAAKLYQNLGVGLFSGFGFSVSTDEKRGLVLTTKRTEKKLFNKKKERGNDEKKDGKKGGFKVKVPMWVIKMFSLKSVKIHGRVGLDNALWTAVFVGATEAVFGLIMSDNRDLAEKSSLYLQADYGKASFEADISFRLEFNVFVIITAAFGILFASLFKRR